MKPVLKIQLQPDDLKKMRAFQSRKRAQKERRCIELFKKANRDFQRIVIMIIKKYQPTRLYQWGSLLDQKKFKEYSDIDIAIEGITEPEIFFTLLDDADRMTEFPVDIVALESIHLLHANSIRTKGKIIYGKE